MHHQVILRALGTTVGIFMLLADPVRASQNVTIDGVEWRVNYTGDYLPNNPLSDPAWTSFYVSPGASATVNAGVLRFEAPANTDQAWAEMENTTYWNGTTASTVEFRMRLQSDGAAYLGAQIYVFDGSRYFGFNIFEDDPFSPGSQGYVSLGNGANYTLDVDSYNVFRVVAYGDGTANLFVNGLAIYDTAVGPTGVSSANRISFGDLSGSGGGVSDWDYFRWTNNGAFAPVPEPQVTALLLLGGLVAGGRMARRVFACRK